MKKASAKTKLLPAVAMLAVSATLLTTASYAWFTMSKKVTVDTFELTATTPDSLEISLGKWGQVNIGTEEAPQNVDAVVAPLATDKLWSNIVKYDSVYKATGKLAPASTVNGYDMFYTEKANSTGEVDGALLASNPFKEANTAAGMLKEVPAADAPKPVDGYYLDLPVWIRTRGANDAEICLKPTVTTVAQDGKTIDLSKAVRISILNTTKDGAAYVPGDASVVPTIWKGDDAAYFNEDKGANKFPAVSAANAITDIATTALIKEPTLTDDVISSFADNGSTILKVLKPANVGDQYGEGVGFIVRIWIEGQDQACKDYNAGVTFNVKLDFYKAAPENP